jgi:hypothetical protein
MLTLPHDFKELLKLFIDQKVRFLIVGGYAVTYHGHPRFTGDLDLWVERSNENAENIVTALKLFGFEAPNLSPRLFTDHDVITRMGVEPMKVEIFTHIPGLIFNQSYPQREELKLDDVGSIPFISREDLKISKKTSGRLQDLADLEKLK